MKISVVLTLIGAAGAISLLSSPVSHAATVVETPAQTAERFDASVSKTSQLPEPATWTMLICGFGAIGVTLRRGRSQRRQNAY